MTAAKASETIRPAYDMWPQYNSRLRDVIGAMSAEQYSWRPGEDVRSVGEVFQHVAADNYLLPAFAGAAPPSATGIKSDDYATVRAYETRAADRATIIADLVHYAMG